MSFRIIGAAFEIPLKGNDKLVFLALCENADDTSRTCYPSYSTIQRKASLANSSLKTSLLVLEAIGLISIKIRSTAKGGRTSTIYKIFEFENKDFDVENYKKIAAKVRAKRNFRVKKEIQAPKIDTFNKCSNLRNSIEFIKDSQAPKIDTNLATQTPKIGEEPLASSFEPLALIDEEDEEAILSLALPYLKISVSIQSLNLMVSKLSKTNPAKFRKKILSKVKNGDIDTIRNVEEFARRLPTPQLPIGTNIFDIIGREGLNYDF